MTNNPKHIHVILKDERIKKFDALKAQFELSSDVDVMRTCLDIAYKQKIDSNVTIRPELLAIAERIAENVFLRKKHLIFTVTDILNEALNNWIQSRYSDYNLHSFSFRQELSEDEQIVSLSFIEHQIEYDKGLTIEQVFEHCPNLEKKIIQRIIRKFLDNDLLQSTKIKQEIYYFAPIA